ncbi:MAG: MarR family transcriptional regulator [Pseudomonadota bacterium]
MQSSDLALMLDQLMRRVHGGLQSRSAEFDTYRVGPLGGIVLMTLAEMGRTRLSELTQRVARDKSQMTRAMHGLEAKGLVTRTASEADARVSLVELTPLGQDVVMGLKQAVVEVIGELLKPISRDEEAQLTELLSRVLEPGKDANP